MPHVFLIGPFRNEPMIKSLHAQTGKWSSSLDKQSNELARNLLLIFKGLSHWTTNITINCATKFATKFATKNEMGLIPIFANKYLRLSNLQNVDAKLLIQLCIKSI